MHLSNTSLFLTFCHPFIPHRIYALYLTDRVCMEPLTPGIQLSNLLQPVAGGTYTEMLARNFKALALGLEKLRHLYQKVEELPTPEPGANRDPLLEIGAPYFLRDKRSVRQAPFPSLP